MSESKNKKRNKILVVIYFILAAVFISYDVYLLIRTPGTLFDNLTSFTHIWSVLGLIFVFFSVYRIKKGHSFWLDTKKWLKIVILSLVGCGAVIAITCLIFIWNPSLADIDEKQDADYLILLGGGIDKNGELPKNVLLRVDAAAEYLNKHKSTICVVSGGQLKWLPVAEAPELKRQLVIRGVEEERILAEDKALDTIQNFQYSCQMLAEYDGRSEKEVLDSEIVVVSNYFHLRRSERLARRMGFTNIKGLGAPIDPIYALHIYVREIAAYIKLNLRIMLTGKPCLIA